MKYVVLDSFYSFFICLSRERQQDTWNKLKTIFEEKRVQGLKQILFFWLIFALFNSRCLFLKYFKYRMKLFVFCGFFRFFHDFSWCNWKATDKKYKWKLIFEDFTTFVGCSSRAETILWIFFGGFFFSFRAIVFVFCFVLFFSWWSQSAERETKKNVKTSDDIKLRAKNCASELCQWDI